MATNEYEEEPGPTRAQQLAAFWGGKVAEATDTDSTLPLRTWILLVVIAVCVLFAAPPFNVVGIVSTVALAMSAASRLRQRRER